MKFLGKSALLAAALAVASSAQAAPRAWLLPSDTAFSGGGDDWVTVDAAISTDLFYPDHPAQAWEPVAYAPDGTTVAVENKASGKLRMVFDLHMTQRGTYKIAVVNSTLIGSYLLNGERKMLPRGTTEATLAKALPEGASDVQSAPNNLRVETFATAGEPTTTVFAATGKGLEMVPVTHPSDLAVGEGATFQFLLDGKPAANLPVSAIPGGVRYRSDLKEMSLTTNAEGKVTITWPEPGMYWVSVNSEPPRPSEGAGPPPAAGEGRMMAPPQRRDTYMMTVEVIG
jgi:uncharacterized GH25 family protein